MHDFPVIVHQRDYRFEVYGQPRDVAKAITHGFFWPRRHNQRHNMEQADKEGYRESSRGASKDAFRHQGERGNRSQTRPGRRSQEPMGPLSPITFEAPSVPDTLDEESLTFSASTPPSYEMCYDNLNGNQLRGRVVPNIDKWKTDHELHLNRMERDAHHDHPQTNRRGATSKKAGGPEKEQGDNGDFSQDPFAIVLSMPPRVMQYLLYETGGLTSYLVGQPTVRDCFLKGYPMGQLKKAAADAGLVVGYSTTRTLPRSTDLAVTLECDDLEALRMVLCGIATMFSNPYVYDKIQDSLSFANCERCRQWDEKLAVVTAAREQERGDNISSDDQWVFMPEVAENTRATAFEVEFVEF